jgi:hypothetical protein
VVHGAPRLPTRSSVVRHHRCQGAGSFSVNMQHLFCSTSRIITPGTGPRICRRLPAGPLCPRASKDTRRLSPVRWEGSGCGPRKSDLTQDRQAAMVRPLYRS